MEKPTQSDLKWADRDNSKQLALVDYHGRLKNESGFNKP
jgi:hypothetical protein